MLSALKTFLFNGLYKFTYLLTYKACNCSVYMTYPICFPITGTSLIDFSSLANGNRPTSVLWFFFVSRLSKVGNRVRARKILCQCHSVRSSINTLHAPRHTLWMRMIYSSDVVLEQRWPFTDVGSTLYSCLLSCFHSHCWGSDITSRTNVLHCCLSLTNREHSKTVLFDQSLTFVLPSELSSNWRSLCTLYRELFMVLRLGTCLIGWAASLTCRLVHLGRQLPSVSFCCNRRTFICFCWPEAMEKSSGWHYICFITDIVSTKTEKHIYFGSHIRTLLCSMFVVMVLAVIYLGHLDNCNVI